jgi:aminoglycoside phosphotransferase (APT) family kinase protein
MGPVPAATIAWVEAAVRDRVRTAAEVPGSSTASLSRIATAGGRRLVLRRYDRPQFLRSEPEAPARQVAALGLLQGRAGAPEVIAADLDGTACGEIVVLTTRLAGRPGPHAPPWPERAAESLAEIHATDPGRLPYRYRRYAAGSAPSPPPWSRERDLWHRAFAVAAAAPEDESGFIHRDFHHGNTLWDGGRVRVVDWTAACRGPAAVDLARFRINLHLAGRAELEPSFIRSYRRAAGAAPNPCWDVVDAVDMLPWDEGEEAVGSWRGPPGIVDPGARHRLESFLARALGSL